MEFNIMNKTICLCGKRHSGKSELIKYILGLYGKKTPSVGLSSFSMAGGSHHSYVGSSLGKEN